MDSEMKERNTDTRKQPRPKVEVRNPRYKGATPEMVGRALLRFRNREAEAEDENEDD